MNKKRILLIGDFSSVHSELKKSLEALGHDVTLVSGGDDFKNFQRDVDIKKEAPDNFLKKAISLLAELFGLRGILFYFKIKPRILSLNLSSFDYIQVINPLAIQRCGAIANILFWRELKKSKSKVFLCALGTDYAYVKASMRKDLKYNYFTSLNLSNLYRYIPSLRFYYFPFYGMMHRYAVSVSKRVIPGLYDYFVAYQNEPKRSQIIPLPISASLLKQPISNPPEKVVIFYGKQKGRDLIKGYRDFDALIEKLKAKHSDEFELITTESIPYSEYLNVFSRCHIFLDQTNSHDRGVNALIGMAAGKVVFSGGGIDSLGPYNTQNLLTAPLMNATPDVEEMYSQIEALIRDPKRIVGISNSAIQFIQQNHDSTKIAKTYLELWNAS